MAWTLADITARMQGRILYFGDPSRTWTLAQWEAAFVQVKTWGFDGAAPKLSDGLDSFYASAPRFERSTAKRRRTA